MKRINVTKSEERYHFFRLILFEPQKCLKCFTFCVLAPRWHKYSVASSPFPSAQRVLVIKLISWTIINMALCYSYDTIIYFGASLSFSIESHPFSTLPLPFPWETLPTEGPNSPCYHPTSPALYFHLTYKLVQLGL